MAFTNEQHRKRYAEDPEHRERKLALGRAYQAGHRERLNVLWRKKWRTNAAFRDGRRARRWQRKYGLGADDYERMVIEQNGVCVICKRIPRRWLCIDHCHETQKVRGLLCDKCNTALGLLDDDSDRMREAGAYVDRARGVGQARGAWEQNIFVPGAASGQRQLPWVHAALVLRAEVGRFGLGRACGPVDAWLPGQTTVAPADVPG